MALFQRKDQFTISKQLYTVGLNKTFLVVGLGNPGKEYINTRHNIGFECLEDFLDNQTEGDFSGWQDRKSLKCIEASGNSGDNRVILIKPTTFMNLSGEAVKLVMAYYKIPIDKVLVVHDELDIDFGHLRLSVGGRSAGHNGIESIIDAIGEDFARVRIGIGPKDPPQIDSSDFVLARFQKPELEKMPELKKEVNALTIESIYSPNFQNETRSFLV